MPCNSVSRGPKLTDDDVISIARTQSAVAWRRYRASFRWDPDVRADLEQTVILAGLALSRKMDTSRSVGEQASYLIRSCFGVAMKTCRAWSRLRHIEHSVDSHDFEPVQRLATVEQLARAIYVALDAEELTAALDRLESGRLPFRWRAMAARITHSL